jgi:lipid II:glycine glycyltransferase (peptidoglycan interpeptide bridge formation enzyme)
MDVVAVTDGQAWDRALLDLPDPQVLQSWAWGELKGRHGWGADRLLFRRGAQVLAAASVLERRALPLSLPRLPASILYVPRGPALDWNDEPLVDEVLGELEALARRRRAVLVKIDPDVYYPEAAPAFAPRPAVAPRVAALLTRRGWRYSDGQVQFRNTVLLDLRPGEETLLAGMRQKSRYNLRLAQRRGVHILQGTAGDLDLFYDLYAETARRDGFAIRPLAYYRDAWGGFLARGQGCLLLARIEGEVVAGLLFVTFGPTAWYLYGASSERHRDLMPNNLLQWEALCRARAAGCTLYDLWGAPENLDESDPMWGVTRFKLGLGGELACGLGAWDYAPWPAAYRLYTTVIPRYLGLLRRRAEAGRGAAQ